MTTLKRFAGVLTIAALVGACDSPVDSDVAPLTNADVAGSFSAQSAVITNPATGQVVDVVGQGGTFDLELRENGTFTRTVVMPNANAIAAQGTFSLSDDGTMISFVEGGESNADPTPFQLDDPNLTLENANIMHPFDGQSPERATVAADLRRK